MMAIPKVLQGLNAFVDGDEFIGVAMKCELALPEPVMKEVKSPSHAGSTQVRTSKWKFDLVKLTLQDYDPRVMTMVGNPASADKPLKLIGVIGPHDPRMVELEVTGEWVESKADGWESESDAIITYAVSPRTYLLKINNKETHYFDIEQNIVRLDGKLITGWINIGLKRS